MYLCLKTDDLQYSQCNVRTCSFLAIYVSLHPCMAGFGPDEINQQTFAYCGMCSAPIKTETGQRATPTTVFRYYIQFRTAAVETQMSATWYGPT